MENDRANITVYIECVHDTDLKSLMVGLKLVNMRIYEASFLDKKTKPTPKQKPKQNEKQRYVYASCHFCVNAEFWEEISQNLPNVASKSLIRQRAIPLMDQHLLHS